MLTLICGLSRSGKTTLSKSYDGVVLHSDCCGYDGVVSRVRRYADVVVEGIYSSKWQRIRLLHAYKGDKTKCIWLDTPIQIRQSRNGYSKHSELPFEPPTYAEGWDEIIVIRENNHD